MFNKEITTAEEYHFSSRNTGGYKFMKNEHLIHYRDDIIALKKRKFVNYDGEVVTLPPPSALNNLSLQTVLEKRRSHRDFTGQSISNQELSNLLYFSNGYRDINAELKHVPSSGGLNSVEAYAIVLSSKDIPLGIYHYDAKTHALENVKYGDFRIWIDEHIFFQEEYSRASVVIVLTSMVSKLSGKYGLRGYRLALMDVGIVSQNIYLVSTAMNLKACASAGFIDTELDEALGIDGFSTTSFLTISIGR